MGKHERDHKVVFFLLGNFRLMRQRGDRAWEDCVGGKMCVCAQKKSGVNRSEAKTSVSEMDQS